MRTKTQRPTALGGGRYERADLKSVSAYRWLEHDPVRDEVVALIEESGMSLEAISRKSGGVSTTTLRRWINGATRRPQNVTLDFVLRGLGYERRIVRRGGGA